ncbi:DUF3151 domain-containing protein [Corynebacterium felinum]|uniref:DUF3151 domain-containing protein n=1 Tax=Corynebacterium felinum TaxID=131318 RepID=A0ABU2B8C5_9CORY|nr:DUF3151 domain-containing protein [Corynebacterium felinum]MDF5820216.1 DUF3151 domain-containing protein [Corynebacterium felinum]MDR7354856.1 hypothetical protein [Corynebacterium felinum]WJY94216.1 hypothetical protein CFELI_02870 [Corynebacterium felinum]
MTQLKDMLAPPPVLLPAEELSAPVSAENALDLALVHPASPLVWATVAESALAQLEGDLAQQKVFAYACARTGYHRSLDRLRANGWKGFGPVPFDHVPNQGVLRAIAALARASAVIGDQAEYDRCRQLLSDADPACVASLLD